MIRQLWMVLLVCVPVTLAGDWTHWRGSHQDGRAEGKNLPESWSVDGENLLWKAPFGTRSAPIVVNGRVHLIGATGSGDRIQETVVALDLKTGKLAWQYKFNVFLTDIVAHRLGWANPCADQETGYVYAHGVQGLFFCFDSDGSVVWKRSLTEEFGRVSGYGGRTHSPVVYGDMVIISFLNSSWGPQGKGQHRYLAMDKRTGEVIWWSTAEGKPKDTTYSTPVFTNVDGTDLMVTGVADGTIRAFKAGSGEEVWKFNLSKRGINVSVLARGNKIYAAHSEENFDNNVMGRLVCIDATGEGDVTKTNELWRIDGLGAGYSSPALGDGMLFISDNAANLHCIDPDSGKQFWSFNFGNACKGSPVYADGKIYVGEESGAYHILKVDRKECKRLSRVSFEKDNGSPIEVYASPAIVDGRVILPTKTDVYCIGTEKSVSGGKVTVQGDSTKQVELGEAVLLRVVPGEAVVKPGAELQLHARTYDAHGRSLGKVDAQWSKKGLPGSIENGVLKVPADAGMAAGVVEAKLGEMSAQARLRVVPELPYEEDFEALEVGKSPAGWITSPLKANVAEVDGQKLLHKLADRSSPIFARLRCYVMPPIEGNYTVQADMVGHAKKRFYPDMGLINARYKLIMLGTTRKPTIRLVTWDPMPRLQVDKEFDWKPGQWYTAKLRVDVDANGEGLVRAKIWARGDSEPQSWSIEMRDPIANTAGSPGVYAYSVGVTDTSPGTDVYFDNVKVYRNQ